MVGGSPLASGVSSDRGEWRLSGEHGGGVVQGEDAHGVAGCFAGAGGVRSEDEARGVEQRGVDIGFAFEDVEGGAADLSVCRALIRAASSTTPPRAVLIRYAVGFMARSAAASMRWRVCGVSGVWTEMTSLSASRVAVSTKVTPSSTVPGSCACAGGDHGHVEGQRAAGDGLADPAVAEDAQGGAGADVEADQHPRAPHPWLAGADEPVAFGDAAGGGEDQRERVVGGGPVQDAGGVGDGDPGGGGRGQVDVVVPDGDVRDDLQLRSGGGEQFGIDAFGEGDDRGARTGDAGFEFGSIGRPFVPTRVGAPSDRRCCMARSVSNRET